MNRNRIIAYGAIIASLYVILTLISAAAGLSSGVIQLRLSEALCVLPAFTFSAVPGLFAGCLISNILTGCAPWDVFFGSLATLAGAFGTYVLRKHRMLRLIPPIIANVIIIPPMLSIVYAFEGSIIYFAITVFAGEFISVGILGYLLGNTLEKRKKDISFN